MNADGLHEEEEMFRLLGGNKESNEDLNDSQNIDAKDWGLFGKEESNEEAGDSQNIDAENWVESDDIEDTHNTNADPNCSNTEYGTNFHLLQRKRKRLPYYRNGQKKEWLVRGTVFKKNKSIKKPCHNCGKSISESNMSKHMKRAICKTNRLEIPFKNRILRYLHRGIDKGKTPNVDNHTFEDMNRPSTSFASTNVRDQLNNTNTIVKGHTKDQIRYRKISRNSNSIVKPILVDDAQDNVPNIGHHDENDISRTIEPITNQNLLVEEELNNAAPTHGPTSPKMIRLNNNDDFDNLPELASIPSPVDQQNMPMECSSEADANDREVNTTVVDHPTDDNFTKHNISKNREDMVSIKTNMKSSNVLKENVSTSNCVSHPSNTKPFVGFRLGKSIQNVFTRNDDKKFGSLRLIYKGPASKQASEKTGNGPKAYSSYKSIIEDGSFGIYSDPGLKRNVNNIYSLYNSVFKKETVTSNESTKRKREKKKDLNFRPQDFSKTVDCLNIFTKGVALPGNQMICYVYKFAPVLQKIQQNGHDQEVDVAINPLDEINNNMYKCGDVHSQTSPCQCTFSEIKSRQCSNYSLYEVLFSIVANAAFVRIYARLYALGKTLNWKLTKDKIDKLASTAELFESPSEFPDLDFVKSHAELSKDFFPEESVQRLFTVARWYLVTALNIEEKENVRKCTTKTPINASNVFASAKFERNDFPDETKSFPNSLNSFNAHLDSDDKDIRTLAALESFKTTLDKNALTFIRQYILKRTCELTQEFMVNKERSAFNVLTKFEPLALVFADIYNNGESLERNLNYLNGFLFSTGNHPLCLIFKDDQKPTTKDFELYVKKAKGDKGITRE